MSGLTIEQLFGPPPAKKPPPVPSAEKTDGDEKKETPSISIDDDKEAKRQRNRQRCVQELVDTEQTYCDQLTVLTELYVVPLKTNGILKDNQHAALFPDIQTISGLNHNLLSTLKEKLKSWDNEKSRIGDEFVKFAPYFKMYQNYVNNHEKATKTLEQLGSSEKFQQFCTQQQTNSRSKGLPLASFLILPIQRIPRYELCFRELLKLTSEEHPDYKDIENTLKEIGGVNATINTRMKDFSSREQVKQVEQRLGGAINLVAPARNYIREGYLTKVCRKKDRKYLFILFSDLLLYCTQNPTGKLSLNQKLPFDRSFRIEDVKNNRKYGSLCFEIHSTVKSFLVHADNLAEKNAWVDDMRSCLSKIATVFSADETKITAPVWFPDDFSEDCMNPVCMKHFTWTRRRHHCRYCGRLVCAECSANKLPNRNKEEEIVRVCDICFRNNKDAFPDLEERLKSKKWFTAKSPKSQDDEEEWDDDSDNSDGETGPSPQETIGVLQKSASLRKISPRRSDNPQSIASKMGLQNDVAETPKQTHFPAHSMSEKRPSRGVPPRTSAPYKPPTTNPPPPSQNASQHTSPLPPPNTDDDVENEESTTERSRGGSLSLPPGLPPNVRNMIVEMDRKYKSTIEVMQGKLETERKKNGEMQRQVKDLMEENERLRKSKVDLVTWANGEINTLKKALKNQQVTAPQQSATEGEGND